MFVYNRMFINEVQMNTNEVQHNVIIAELPCLSQCRLELFCWEWIISISWSTQNLNIYHVWSLQCNRQIVKTHTVSLNEDSNTTTTTTNNDNNKQF